MELKTILTSNLRLKSRLSFQVQVTGQYCSFGRSSPRNAKLRRLEKSCWGLGETRDGSIQLATLISRPSASHEALCVVALPHNALRNDCQII